MSYILDALRKSESERQRETPASLSHAPLATVRHRVPFWTWLVIVLLTVSVIALAAAWWRTDEAPPSAASSGGAVTALPATPIERVPTATPPETPESVAARPEGLQPIDELTARHPALPEYRLELIAHNSQDPGASSAWINGRRYFVGERIGSGPELVEVRPDAVVFEYSGARYLLTTR